MSSTKTVLTSCQSSALRALEDLVSGNKKVGVLRGFAGTGKTYLTALFAKRLEEQAWRVIIMTPTGRAARVLISELAEHKVICTPRTIHSSIYKIEPVDYSGNQLTLFANVGTAEVEGKTFYIVDEASMVGNQRVDQKTEGLNFGSGSLMDDILEFVKFESNPDDRLLFVGDPAQLPPVVGSDQSPALSADTIQTALSERDVDSEVVECDLEEVLRQSEGGLKQFVTDVRTCLSSGEGLPKDRRDQVNPLKREHLTEKYRSLTSGFRSPHKVIVLAYSNKKVFEYNERIRNEMSDDPSILRKGEMLLVRRNRTVVDRGELDISHDALDVANGTFIRVNAEPEFVREAYVKLNKGKVNLRFWKIRFNTIGSRKQSEQIVLENMLRPEYWYDHKANFKLLEGAILRDFQTRTIEKHGIRPVKPGEDGYGRFKTLAENDPFLNALRVNYGYSVTVHNAQGGAWPIVIVDPFTKARDWPHEKYQRAYKRWIYTASTRAVDELYFISNNEKLPAENAIQSV